MNKNELNILVNELKEMINTRPIVPMLFCDWARIWLTTWKKHIVSDIAYADTYRRPVELHLIPYFGEYLLHEITPLMVQRFFNEKGRTYTMESLRKMKFPLKSIFETAVENGHCERSPVTSSIRLNSRIPKREKKAWTQTEYDTALAFTKVYPEGLPFWLLMECAVSRSELLALRVQDVNLEERTLTICGGIVETINAETSKWEIQRSAGKNRYRNRTIPLSIALTEALRVKVRCKHRSAYLFENSHGNPKSPHNWYHREYIPWMKSLCSTHPDIRYLSPHELRHTRATLPRHRPTQGQHPELPHQRRV